ncbi:uncharacterized protein LOC108911779 [Anoplophora glabripennis]|uniref:uncharacterized protein LOC108911779 n=1 Tax=Anoplophora glabripennis TaxID=217634 RepID=UPI000874C98F|nr:uncharacterized protein LOC108911779 [Anoplophora glabripennis]
MSSIKEVVVNELHKPARKKFRRRHVLVRGLNDLIQADLVEMIPYVNKGYRYILVVINIFSKFVWVEPVKRKTAKEVSNAMAKILSQMKYMPHNCQTDLGTEFYNKEFKNLMTQLKINHYSMYSNLKASVVERISRTLKNLMWKQFSLQGTYKWINILPEIVNRYNETQHRTHGLDPIKVNNKNDTKLLQTAYSLQP